MFRFTIRELLLLTVIVAVGVGWWIDRRRLESQVEKLNLELFRQKLLSLPVDA